MKKLLMVVVLLLATPVQAKANSTVGLNFTATTLSTSSENTVPPDSNIAVGDNTIVELINGTYAVFDKATGAKLLQESSDSIYSQGGIANPGGSRDMRILYDTSINRFITSSQDAAGNNYDFSISKTGNPLDGWNAYQIPVNSTGLGDFPTLGITQSAITLSSGIFGGTNPTSFISIDKSSLLAGNPLITNSLSDRFKIGFIVQPAVDPTSSTQYTLSSVANNAIQLGTVSASNGIATPTLVSGVAVPSYSQPPNFTSGGTTNLDTGDLRFGSSVVAGLNNDIWGVRGVTADNGKAGLQWFDVSKTGTLLQSGIISDATKDLFYGSIALSNAGIVIGSSCAAQSSFVSSCYVTGKTTNGVTAFAPVQVAQAGNSDYNIDYGGGNRWGDYSATVVDPNDPTKFYLGQEIAKDKQWAIQITQIGLNDVGFGVPEPSTIAGVLLAKIGLLCLFRRKKDGNI